MSYNRTQSIAMALCPKFTALGSVIASTLIIRDMFQAWRTDARKITPRHRIITGMSVCDVIASLAWFLTSWPMPAELTYTIWNVGTTKTCTAQGFFMQIGFGTVAYNFCLALYYLVVIRYRWTNRSVAKRLEPFMHVFAIGFVVVTNTVALSLQLFNPLGYHCWIASYPYFCTQSYENKGPSDCLRGDNARIYRWVFGYGLVFFVMAFLVISMLLVFCKIRSSERRGSARRLTGDPGRLQRKFAWQAILYVGAFFASWSLGIAAHTYLEVTGTGAVYWVSFLALFLVPSQGIFNAIVYFSTFTETTSPLSSLVRSLRSSMSFRQVRGNTDESCVRGAMDNVNDCAPSKQPPGVADESVLDPTDEI